VCFVVCLLCEFVCVLCLMCVFVFVLCVCKPLIEFVPRGVCPGRNPPAAYHPCFLKLDLVTHLSVFTRIKKVIAHN
jgi:hypothetical protein